MVGLVFCGQIGMVVVFGFFGVGKDQDLFGVVYERLGFCDIGLW